MNDEATDQVTTPPTSDTAPADNTADTSADNTGANPGDPGVDPGIEISEQEAATREAEDDALLDNLLDQEGFGEQESAGQTPANTDNTSDNTPDNGADNKTTTFDVQTPPKGVDSEAWQRAIGALQNDKAPAAAIEQMAKDNPQALVAWGLQRAADQAESGAGGNVRSDESRAREADDAQDGAGSGSERSESGDSDIDTNAMANAFAETFDDFGGDVVSGLQKATKVMLDGLVEKLKGGSGGDSQEMARLKTQLAEVQEQHGRHLIDEARSTLSDHFPQLEDDAAFAALKPTLKKLANSEAFGSVEELMRAAAVKEYGLPSGVSRSAERDMREKGQPRGSGGGRSGSPAKRTTEQREDEFLDALLDAESGARTMDEAMALAPPR